MEIKDSWIKQAKVDSQTYEIKYKTSLDDNDNFWREEGKRLDWVNNYTKIKDVKYSKNEVDIKWYYDGSLNVSYNCIDRHARNNPDGIAIIWEGDDPNNVKKISYKELLVNVSKAANVLKKIGVKKGDEKIVEATLPENFPEKDLVNKIAKFKCKIISVKNPDEVKIDDNFAKNLGAKDLNDLKILISKQINDEYKNSLDRLSKNQILKEIEKFKVNEIPENLLEEEIKVLSQGMSDDDAKKSRKNFEEIAKKRIKVGLILNEFGEQNKIKVTEQELQAEVQKQIKETLEKYKHLNLKQPSIEKRKEIRIKKGLMKRSRLKLIKK